MATVGHLMGHVFGIRLKNIYIFIFIRDKSSTPSGFTLKLRKHIRTKRLEEVRQLGMDRVRYLSHLYNGNLDLCIYFVLRDTKFWQTEKFNQTVTKLNPSSNPLEFASHCLMFSLMGWNKNKNSTLDEIMGQISGPVTIII